MARHFFSSQKSLLHMVKRPWSIAAFYPMQQKQGRPWPTNIHLNLIFHDDSIFEPDAARLYLIFIGDVVLSTVRFLENGAWPFWSGDSVSLYECVVAIFIAILSRIRFLTSLLLFSIDRSLIIRCIVCQRVLCSSWWCWLKLLFVATYRLILYRHVRNISKDGVVEVSYNFSVVTILVGYVVFQLW